MDDRRWAHLALVLLLCVVFVGYANTIDDLDFWWHLKHGRLLFDTWSLPKEDPFALTTDLPDSVARIGRDEVDPSELPGTEGAYWKLALTSAWLSQILLYASYRVAGFGGVAVLKSFVFTMSYLLLFLTMRERKAGSLASVVVLCLVAWVGLDFNYTRSQIFSLLLFSGLLYLLERSRRSPRVAYVLPLLMIIWANLHGAFILGVVVTFLFAAGRVLDDLLKARSVSGPTRVFLGAALLSGAASLLNPTSYEAFLFPFVNARSIFFIVEYLSPRLNQYHVYWVMLVLTVLSTVFLVARRKALSTDLLITAALAAASLNGIRYIVFFALGASLPVSLAMTEAFGLLGARPAGVSSLRRVVPVPAVVLGFLFVFLAATGRTFKFAVEKDRYPVEAVKFIRTNGIPANMFNYYGWGGYLIWELAPEQKVFIDGRTLNENAYFHYRQIMRAERGRGLSPLWERLLDAYNIAFIIIPAVEPFSGVVVPLFNELSAHPGWKAVYADGKSVIFLRNSPGNGPLIGRYQISRGDLIREVIMECETALDRGRKIWGYHTVPPLYYETLGNAYLAENRLRDALDMLERYLEADPSDQQVSEQVRFLKAYLGN